MADVVDLFKSEIKSGLLFGSLLLDYSLDLNLGPLRNVTDDCGAVSYTHLDVYKRQADLSVVRQPEEVAEPDGKVGSDAEQVKMCIRDRSRMSPIRRLSA